MKYMESIINENGAQMRVTDKGLRRSQTLRKGREAAAE